MIEAGKKYPLKGGGEAMIHRKAFATDHPRVKDGSFFWVKLSLIQFSGVFFLYHANGRYVDEPFGPPSIECGVAAEEDFLAEMLREEAFGIQLEEEEFLF
jgi:hypothetical protein